MQRGFCLLVLYQHEHAGVASFGDRLGAQKVLENPSFESELQSNSESRIRTTDPPRTVLERKPNLRDCY